MEEDDGEIRARGRLAQVEDRLRGILAMSTVLGLVDDDVGVEVMADYMNVISELAMSALDDMDRNERRMPS